MATVTGQSKKKMEKVNNFESLKKIRGVLKDEHEDACIEFYESLEKDELDIKVSWKRLCDVKERLNEVSEQYLEVAALTLNQEELKCEMEATRHAKREFFKCETLYEGRFAKASVSSGSAEMNKETYRLPRLEIKTFDGAPNNWLPFWYQFKRIHEDHSICKVDKIQYLHQFTTGKVRELVDGYPQTEDNYERILQHMKERYASPKLLIRYYVKEILKIVVEPKLKISVEQLQQTLEINLRALETLGVTQDKYCNLLLPLVEAALPENLLMMWHRHCSLAEQQGDPSINGEGELESLLKFLRQEVTSRNKVQEAGFSLNVKRGTPHTQSSLERGGTASALVNSPKQQNNCIFCGKFNHLSCNCFLAKKWDLKDRKKVVFNKGACFCCLKMGHRADQCQLDFKCQVCSGKHAVLLCEQAGKKKEDTITCLSSLRGKNSYLPTVVVNVIENQQIRTVRALIDSGCQRSYILENLAKELKLKPVGQEVLAKCLFGGVVSKSKRYNLYGIVVCDMEGEFRMELDVLGEDALCHFVPSIDRSVTNKFPELSFSDCNKNLPISIVFGADVFGNIFVEASTVCRDKFTAFKTKLGWVLTGPREMGSCMTMLTTCLKNSAIPTLWELEVLGIKEQPETKQADVLNVETLEYFKKTVSRNENGRYSVSLPWLSDHPVLPDNRDIAEHRLKSMTSRLCKNNFTDLYQSVLDEWQNLGIIEVVPNDELDRPCHYLAHRPVVKMAKETTKVRPVFDASCSKDGQPSLNDCLSKGPNLLEMIIPLLIKFRLCKYGLVADIEKAFLQIDLKKQDQDFLRFLWWKQDKVKSEILVYRHKRLVFGVSCSPFLLNATISHHLSKFEGEKYETEIVKLLASSLYVDDCIVSVNSMDELEMFVRVAEKVMKDACFNLRGWKHNNSALPEAGVMNKTLVLGLLWDLNADTLSVAFKFDENFSQEPLTKRKLLSVANKIFDPLGFLSPVSLIPKLLLQQTWKLKVHWDDELPHEILNKFKLWAKHLHCVNECKLPRWLFSQSIDWERCSLHVFSDASNVAYAACVFLRAEEDSGVRVQLFLAKGRVAPLKDISIPRMELLGACIGVRLALTVQKALPIKLPSVYWTDSRVVLSWILRSDQWNVFVRNRVDEIRKNTEIENWRHVPGALNPADLLSRGCSASKLLEQKWWNGPKWLSMNPSEWPQEEGVADEDEVLREKRKGVCLAAVQNESFLDFFTHYFSCYNKIVRMCAWMLRFNFRLKNLCHLRKVKNPKERLEIQHKLDRMKGELSGEEIIMAELTLIKLLQKECVNMNDLKTFVGLKLFRDEKGVIRVQSRLTLGLDEDYFQNPMILVDHELVRRLILAEHVALGHTGVLTTLAQLRERFFIIRGRQLVKRIVKSCVICRKLLAKPFAVPEAPLPVERTARVAAFQVSGVDLGGPLFIRKGKKVWFAIFTCAVYRAVHLELVDSLSTEAFIMALRRFIARRGRIKTLFSDQGTNFVGTSNLLRRLDRDLLQKECSVQHIVWKFNPPSAPWWGGWWERLVGLVKVALRKTLGKAYLNYVELETILCDIESTINGRPLTYLSEDPKELGVITPAHFIQDFPGSGTIDLDEVDQEFLGKRIKYIQSVRAHLRERFKKEYLGELLNRRNKRGKVSPEIKVGDVVLVEDHLQKRINWPLGRVVELIPGRDGKCRAVKLQLESGHLTRPVQRLYPLEIQQKLASDLAEGVVKTNSGRVVRPVCRLDL